jgi:hypothetical protein
MSKDDIAVGAFPLLGMSADAPGPVDHRGPRTDPDPQQLIITEENVTPRAVFS